MDYANLFSIIFYTASISSLFLGMYIISLNYKNALNQQFLLISLALCLWSFCFSVANNAPDLNTVLYWRRISVFGWGIIYTLILHFFVLLARKYYGALKRSIFLFYVPAVMVVYVFGISPLAPERYEFVRTITGWVNISPFDNIWDWFFSLYCTSYILLSLYLLYNWGQRTRRKNNKKQAGFIIAAFLLALVSGFLTDFFFNMLIDVKIPQLAPLIGIIPFSAIFYYIRKYGFIRIDEGREAKPGMILSEFDLSKYYETVSSTYIIGSILNFIIQFFLKRSSIETILPISVFLFFIGIIVWMMPVFIKKDRVRDILFTIIISLSIPLAVIFPISSDNAIIWFIPVALVIFSLIYNQRYLLYSVAFSCLFTQVSLWIKNPVIVIKLDDAEYLKRVFFFLVCMSITYYIYRVYFYRLKEIEGKIKLQQIVAKISAQFAAATIDTIDDRINEMLQVSGDFFRADRAFVYMFSKDRITHEWRNGYMEGNTKKSQELLRDYLSELKNSKLHNKLIKMPALQGTAANNNRRSLFFRAGKCKFLFAVPLSKKDQPVGVIAYILNQRRSDWKTGYQNSLEILANILSDSLARIESEAHITHLVYHNRLTDLPNKRYFDKFVNNKLDSGIKQKKALILVNYRDFTLTSMTYGYNYSNDIIRKTAEELSNFMRGSISLFHVSIDHFVLWVENYRDKSELDKLCIKIIDLLKDRFSGRVSGGNIGIVEIDKYDEDSDTLLKYASIAANSVKREKDWGYSYFTEKMEVDINKKRQIEDGLKKIISGDESQSNIYLKYQPIIELKDNRIVGFEALARMYNQDLGEIPPLEFIPIAENTHQIYQLGELIIHKACQFLKEMEYKGYSEQMVMLNISVLQILRDEFVEDFLGLINKYGIDYPRIGIELTESVFSKDYMKINEKLMKLQDLGINIAIDDFGTGYSSFARERELNVNCLKIDKYFVDKLLDIGYRNAITGDIISMAHKLGHRAIAEGVEREIQKQYLIENSCDYMQGYLYSMPVLQEKALKMLGET
ncbi:MAG: EAL domain-containing protein [Halanaerobiaceae bacterium]|nr:EAL domain-containing protein [Halanaerobiaceae bacterium]